ncbi:MAG: hypothetical protein WAM97_14075 [Acidimicrobiales bacterium]
MIWAVAAFMAVVALLSLYRLRKGGVGPQMNWIPKLMRPRANEYYEKHGWKQPFNDEGNRRGGRWT